MQFATRLPDPAFMQSASDQLQIAPKFALEPPSASLGGYGTVKAETIQPKI
jgi:hypothetical protein